MEWWQLLLVILVAVAVGAVVAFLLVRRRERALALERVSHLFVESIQARLEEWEIVVPPPSKERAIESAEQRLKSIREFFSRRDIPYEPELDQDVPLLFDEYLEVLPDIGEVQSRRFEDERAAAGQLARLLWQRKSPERALGERVVDVVTTFHRIEGFDHQSREYPTIKVEKLDQHTYGESVFPWVVVIEDSRSDLYREIVGRLSSWLGIAVAFGPSRRVNLFEGCTVGTGMAGVVGGGFSTDMDEYHLTCSHVLSPDCHSLAFDQHPRTDSNQPDAALLRTRNPCFHGPSSRDGCNVVVATSTDVQSYIQTRTEVTKRHPSCNTRKGIVRNRAHSFDIQGVFHRFPHLEILPSLGPVDSTFLRLWPRSFSKPGDSGCWVFDTEQNRWIGMIVGGDEYFLSTFALEAEPLFEYFRLLLQHGNRGRLLSAFTH